MALQIVCLLLSVLALTACRDETPAPPDPDPSDPTPAAIFTDAAEASGLDFVHFNGMSGAMYIVEMVGPGAALFDYDNDGDLDVYLVQGAMLGDKPVADAIFPPPAGQPRGDRLYRNDLHKDAQGRPVLHFTDVTAAAGIAVDGYGMGVASGDYDNDGWTDLYITGLGHNTLLRNRGDGSFEDVTARTGVDDPRWSTSTMFVDVNQDGWLDLFVCNYVDFRTDRHKPCFDRGGAWDYCGPKTYKAQADTLFRNLGTGGFEDWTAPSGLIHGYGACLGAVNADFNGDGLVDLYLANDGMDNLLWINQGHGRFLNEAALAGVALNWEGMSEASMGVDAADFDNDGDEDIFVTHLKQETNTLYVNDGEALFEDTTLGTGLSTGSRPYTGFGTAWIDYDNDGWLDLFIANGEVKHIEALARAGDPYPLHQKNQLFRNLGNGKFEDVSARAGTVFGLSEVSRAAAFGDIDNDGDTDLLVTNNAGPVRLLLNQVGNRNHWLGLRLLDRNTGRPVHGARVEIIRKDKPSLWRRVRVAASFLSANDPRILVGLGKDTELEGVRVVWPDGETKTVHHLLVDAYTTFYRSQ